MSSSLLESVAALPVADVHCHPFVDTGELAPESLLDALAFPGGGVQFLEEAGAGPRAALRAEIFEQRRQTLYVHYALRRLAEFFGVEPTLEAVAAARNAASSAGYSSYIRRLYDACGLQTLVVDFGYPQPPVDRGQFERDVSVEVVPVFRIEPLIAQLLATDIGWAEFRRRFDETIARALQQEGYRGLKSVIAYRTGLAVSPLSRGPDQGLQALDAIRRGVGGNATKKLRDHLLCRALELCMEFDVPMQIHTGMGDYEVNLVECRPALLMDLLRFPVLRACRVLLVHTGYPYHAEAGYMANMLPRVYCDVSEGIPFAAQAARRIFAEVLEMAPLHKVCFGTDGFTTPEINFVGVQLGKQALAQALDSLVQDRFLSLADAQAAAAGILSENARRLYGLA